MFGQISSIRIRIFGNIFRTLLNLGVVIVLRLSLEIRC